MKKLKNSWLICLLCPLAVVVGCTRVIERTQQVPATPDLPISNVYPTETFTLNPEFISTNGLNATFIPTVAPTLSVEDARQRLLELLVTNGNCQLPCLWGITPGESKSVQARSILMPLISVAEIADFEATGADDINPLYVDGDLRLNTLIAYSYGSDGVIQGINFQTREEEKTNSPDGNWVLTPLYDSSIFGKRVEYYSLAHVLTEQGMPDEVMIEFSGKSGYPTVAGGLEIALLYPDQGIWVNYETTMYNQGNIKKGCPANAHIEMELYPPENPERFYSNLEMTDWSVIKNGYLSLKEAASMSIEEFYETFRAPTDQCIETPANIWPTPEYNGR